MTTKEFKQIIETAALSTAVLGFTNGFNEEVNQAGTLFPHFRHFPENWGDTRKDYFTFDASFYIYGSDGTTREDSWDYLIGLWVAFKVALAGTAVEVVAPIDKFTLYQPGQAVQDVHCIEIKTTLKIYC